LGEKELLTTVRNISPYGRVRDLRGQIPNNPRPPHCAGLRLHCVARLIWRLVKTPFGQTLTNRYPANSPLLVSTNGEEGSHFVPFYCRQKLGLFDGLSGRVSDRREFSTTPSTKVNFWVKAISGALLFGSFILGKQNK